MKGYGQKRYIQKTISLVEKNHPHTTNVVLNGFNIVDAKLAVLAMALVNNTHVTRLHLDGNSITDRGAGLIAYALQQNETLTFLSLNDNHIGSAGVDAISASLYMNKSLRTLRLANNMIGDRGGKKLRKMLRQNRSLEEIYLGGNRINRTIMDKFDDRCKVQHFVKIEAAARDADATTSIVESTSIIDFTPCSNADVDGENIVDDCDKENYDTSHAWDSSMASLFGASLYIKNDDARKYILGCEDTRERDFDTSWNDLASYMVKVQKTIDRSGEGNEEECNHDDLMSVVSSEWEEDQAATSEDKVKTRWSMFKRTIAGKKMHAVRR